MRTSCSVWYDKRDDSKVEGWNGSTRRVRALDDNRHRRDRPQRNLVVSLNRELTVSHNWRYVTSYGEILTSEGL